MDTANVFPPSEGARAVVNDSSRPAAIVSDHGVLTEDVRIGPTRTITPSA